MIKFVYFLGINHMLRSIQKITDYLFEEIFTPLLNYICLIMLIVTCTGIICRYVFHIALVFSPELSRYLYIFIIFIGTFLGIKNNTHVGVDVFVNLLPTKMKKIIMIFRNISMLIFSIFITYYGFKFVSVGMSQSTLSLGISKGWIYLILPICGIFMFLIVLNETLTFTDKKFWTKKEE